METTDQPRLRLTSAFDTFAVQLIQGMEDYGWRGRVSSRGHAIMRSPDGMTSCSISPKVGSPRHRGNQAAPFKRWLREQRNAGLIDQVDQDESTTAEMVEVREPTPVEQVFEDETFAQVRAVPDPVDTVSEPEPEVRSPFACPIEDCGRVFAGRQPLSVHHVRAHVKVQCPICDTSMSPGNLPRHQQARHPMGDPLDLARQLWQAQQTIARLRSEAQGWQEIAEEAEQQMTELVNRLATIRAALDAP